MKRRRSFLTAFRFLALAFIFAAVLLTVLQLVSYSRIRNNFSPGMVIAGVAVGGLNQQQAADRITQLYSLPIEVHYQDASFFLEPSTAGFDLDMEAMLTAADLQRLKQPFWTAFWEYLWNRLPAPTPVPLRASISEERLRQYLIEEVSPRYDVEPTPAMSLSGSPEFEPGTPGTQIDFERSIPLIEEALRSSTNRVTNISYTITNPPRPSIDYLKALLQRNIDRSGFDGIAEIYLLDLTTREELHFAYRQNEEIPPDISFTAASTMKIPIMVSTFIRQEFPIDDYIGNQVQLMIERSENDPADRLMEFIGGNLGPLVVTEDLRKLGFEDSFIAGYYYFGAPLLDRISTAANERTDVNVEPDPYNQTVSSDMGSLLDDIYQCAANNGGTFAALYQDELTQAECQQMLAYLSNNRIGVLIQAGLPDGTKIAHKHGWITEADGLIHTMSDVGIVYTPGGNYVLNIFLWHPVQLYFDNGNELFADLSRAIYNYFNLSEQ